MLDTTSGRWMQQDPIGFDAEDPNLYRYVGNNPTNATDPSGLWAWKLDGTGRIKAVAEDGDNAQSLINQGYVQNKVNLPAMIRKGAEVDVTGLFPDWVGKELQRQQQLLILDFEEAVKRAGYQTQAIRMKTLGATGIDLMTTPDYQKVTIEGEVVEKQIRWALEDNAVFSAGNCFGFVGMSLGLTPVPAGINPTRVAISVLPKDRRPGAMADSVPLRKDDPTAGIAIVPEGGLEAWLLRSGWKETKTPQFGSIAVFRVATESQLSTVRKGDITHMAVVLGASRDGTVYVLQKLGCYQPMAVSKITHPMVALDRTITYFAK